MTRQVRTIGIVGSAVILAAAGLLMLSACTTPPSSEKGAGMQNDQQAQRATGTYQTIDADAGQRLMAEGDNVVLVDVRTPAEYEEKHIPGAINIPVETIGGAKPAELTDTDAELIIYCRSGVRSKQAADKLINLGYQRVSDMGGIIDWTGDTVSGAQPDGS